MKCEMPAMPTNITCGDNPVTSDYEEQLWWKYLVIQAVLYLLLLGSFALIYVTYWLLVVKYKVCTCPKFSIWKHFHDFVRDLVSGYSVLGKILISVTLLCNLIYIGIAIERSLPNKIIECLDLRNPEVIIEIIIVIELLIFALIRLLACKNLLLFWLELYTIVDVLTLSHIFIVMYYGVDWIGLRSLRFIWLTQVSLFLQFTSFVRSQNAINLINLLIYFLILWFTSSGILHLIEAQGDFWNDDADPHSVLIYIYLTMVTMSTVGYGDFSPVTDLGKAFMILFIIAGLAFFAAILPTLVEVVIDLYAKHQYARFDTTRVPRHVIVCGHVTATTARDFLEDFLHPDRGDTKTHILFLHPERPDRDLKNVLHSYYTRVQFLLGSVLKGEDLHKAQILNSTAIFILANKHTHNPTEEDNANLLRVVSVKNTSKSVPVIIQVLNSFSKVQASNIEGWSHIRDIAICLNELKLGLLAQSCLCPGFSTLIANLFYISDFPDVTSFSEKHEWKEHYIKGATKEVYSSTFSKHFDGMTFHKAAEVCFNKLKLVLLALEELDQNSHRYYVNPSDQSVTINHNNMIGYFIARDEVRVSVVSFYCECCPNHKHISANAEQIQLKQELTYRRRSLTVVKPEKEVSQNIPLESIEEREEIAVQFDLPSSSDPDITETADEAPLVITQAAMLDEMVSPMPSDASEDDEHDDYEKWKVHTTDPVPLEKVILNPDNLLSDRPDHIPDEELEDHVILCLFADADSPPLGLQNFLKPLRIKRLPVESIKPVVIICEKAFIEKEWPIICDIPKVYLVVGSPLLWSNLTVAKVSKCSVCVILTLLNTSSIYERAIDDKEAILCNLHIQKKLHKEHKKVLIITDLRQESNAQFLHFEDEDTPDERIYKAQPFACGETFSVSMFDSVTSSVFHGPGTLYLVEGLLCSAGTKTTCQIVSKPISETDFSGKTFGEFFNAQLEESMICLGLSRELTPGGNQNYVITSPDPNVVLRESDIIFILA